MPRPQPLPLRRALRPRSRVLPVKPPVRPSRKRVENSEDDGDARDEEDCDERSVAREGCVVVGGHGGGGAELRISVAERIRERIQTRGDFFFILGRECLASHPAEKGLCAGGAVSEWVGGLEVGFVAHRDCVGAEPQPHGHRLLVFLRDGLLSHNLAVEVPWVQTRFGAIDH